ncbi:MAG: LutB/LldF family L-lactate oxidation iron-sulfur protein [Hyphomicrobium sp.]
MIVHDFKSAASEALGNPQLRRALDGLPGGLVAQRAAAKARVPEFEAMRTIARDIKDQALADLDLYLEAFEARATAAGTRVHWASTAGEACDLILGLCRAANARLVVKSKSMVAEEIGLNPHLEAAGLDVVETDLGEYIVQIRGEMPSHIIAPAIHLTKEQIEADFRRRHSALPPDRPLAEPAQLVAEARLVMREKFLAADVGITGANFLVAETGSAIIVTNEGNADLTHTLPRIHIVITSIEKVVPSLEDAMALLRVLARSGTGQEMTAYTTLVTGPRREGDCDGPAECHVVIVDNGRSDILASKAREVLRCIRCGACMNHCPVYGQIGGHAYGTLYSGPIGAVLSPALLGIAAARHPPNASTFCGACEAVCPVKIPLPGLMRRFRESERDAGLHSFGQRFGLGAWAFVARRPRLYHGLARFAAAILGAVGRKHGRLRRLPFARGWTETRDLPAPQGRTFQQLWSETRRGVPR